MPPSRLRWLMIALVFWATVINYLDRQALSVAAPALRAEFDMSNVAYSRVVFGFLLAYTISNGLSGALIDRLGTRLGYAVCIAWWSAAALLHPLATGPWSLGAARFLLGIGEAGNWPAGVKVVAEWFPPRERALAAGLFNSGSSIGAILAPPLISWILLQFGWQAAFLSVGATGFLWLLVWWPVYHTPPPTPQSPSASEGPPPAPWRLFRHPYVWTFALSKVFLDPAWYFYIFWFPEYLNKGRGFDMAAIGRYGWIPFLVAGAGNLLGGWLAAALLNRGLSVNHARKGAVTVFAFLMLAAIPAVLAPDAFTAIALVSVAMVGYTGANANMLALPADVFPGSMVSSVYGLASMGSGFGGMLFTLLTGWLVDRFSYTPVFFLFGLIPLVCSAVLWRLMGPLEPRPASPGAVN